MSTPAISVKNLTKRYGRVTAVDDISFEVPAGSVFAFLGTNGAGKSTTISCLTTVAPFDHGEVVVAGHNVRTAGDAVRGTIGVVFQDSLLDPLLTARENLAVRARFYSSDRHAIDERISELSTLIGLDEFLGRRYGTFSGGERRRVDIARALLQSPSIIFLDEPTAGLDPIGAAGFDRLTRELQQTLGLTVFLITHDLDTLHEICDRVAVIADRRVIAVDTVPRLMELDHAWIQEYFNGPRGRAALTAQALDELRQHTDQPVVARAVKALDKSGEGEA